ncbi:alpha/beta hydrolase family protein [Halomonas huangheensis]|uniref:Peptidase S9 prolyl oligopeptidase catalytic domain-containing protein n=1 Tax=Halomonas huangheensis TaxID=1178482 RepID=W1NC40_9GAMM|nr:acyl-CoA thioester hydrolase/BAAT C-terminal domain-containing protein [Halomonas huangheensis]ALM52949.1 thioesterase [Halomonas huangheensis]ERL53127.1 hypothetical protein BJB45_17785 [Halomonas huangheensis]
MELQIVRRLMPLSQDQWSTTYGPAGDGPFPAVMVLHGSEGPWSGWSHRNAVILAAHGFLAFPFSYSEGGNAWNAGHIRDCPLDRGVEALAALRAFNFSQSRVGVYGVSRGAEYALLMATLMAREGMSGLPDALAAHSPPDSICAAFDSRMYRDVGEADWRAWDAAERAWTWRGTHEGLLPTTPIEIEQYAGPLMLSHGTADTVWTVDMTRRLEQRLVDHGRNPSVHYYQGEDHIPRSVAENDHHQHLLAFFSEHLTDSALV